MSSRARRTFEVATALAAHVPLAALPRVGETTGRIARRFAPSKAAVLAENLQRVCPELSQRELDELVDDGFASYGRYYAESLRVPDISATDLFEGMRVDGYEHIVAAREAGFGPIMVLPHMGGWEWAAAWLGRVADVPVTAVVERLKPEDVFDWFVDLRASYGVSVVPLGGDAMSALSRAVKNRHVVCLLSDRDLAGNGTPVELFGATTTIPSGPAMLSRRTGAPLLPTVVLFDGPTGHHCIVGEPIWPTAGSLRESIAHATAKMARHFEAMIRQAPAQWHVLEPIWPQSAPAMGHPPTLPDEG